MPKFTVVIYATEWRTYCLEVDDEETAINMALERQPDNVEPVELYVDSVSRDE